MLLRTLCTSRIARTQARRTKWRWLPARPYTSTNPDDPPWFQQLRAEMLNREVTYLHEDITAQPGFRLANTLSGFLPEEWWRAPNFKNPVLPVGHHLIWFNAALPTDKLLPDGTDASQSPGEPWVRRMWAGGSLQLKPDEYYHKRHGFILNTAIASAERIKDVKLRGQDDGAKVFVTIERRFARLDHLYESHRKAHGNSEKSNGINVQRHYKQQLRDDEEWGDAIFKEERNLVFFKDRTTTELEAIKAGQMAIIRYLDPPGKPDFSHTLTPTRSLLFRYSALTFNAHLIHLDRDYARNVEGHRNLLVHGPLSLTLMLQAISGHINTLTQGREVIDTIEYRNLAPLYCDEQMRICGMLKKRSSLGSIYEVWVEGPTGGVAVKGTVHTSVKKLGSPVLSATSRGQENPTSTSGENNKARKNRMQSESINASMKEQAEKSERPLVRRVDMHALWEPRKSKANKPIPKPSQPKLAPETASTTFSPPFAPESEILDEVSSPMSFEQSNVSPSPSVGRANRRNRPTRIRSHQFIIPNSSLPIRRVNAFVPLKPIVSPRSRHIFMRRLRHRIPSKVKPVPLVRKQSVSPYHRDPSRTAARHSRFRREGVRKFATPSIRKVGEGLGSVGRRRSARYGR